MSEVWIRGSGSVPKFHRSATLKQENNYDKVASNNKYGELLISNLSDFLPRTFFASESRRAGYPVSARQLHHNPSYKTQCKASSRHRKPTKPKNFLNFLAFLWFIFAFLGPDSDFRYPDPQTILSGSRSEIFSVKLGFLTDIFSILKILDQQKAWPHPWNWNQPVRIRKIPRSAGKNYPHL